ncbi:hypothetical protein MVEG_02609 [Podila verticillata NRRL 6337]|nr:hypothetical protein MVEG_02609 [Podila verticillata NRRL 6337]
MSSTLKRSASSSQPLGCYQLGKFASPPSMRHHRRSVDRIWPPALEVKLARLSMDDDLRRSNLIEAKLEEDSSSDNSPASHIIPLLPLLVHGSGRYSSLRHYSGVNIDGNGDYNCSAGDNSCDDDSRIQRISIWREHHQEQQSQTLDAMKQHRHSYECIYSKNFSSGRSIASSPSIAPSIFSLISQSYYQPGTIPEQLHPFDQVSTNNHPPTYTQRPRQHPSPRAQIDVEYIHLCKSDGRSSPSTKHRGINDSAFTSLPMAIAASSSPNDRSLYSPSSSFLSSSSSPRSPLSPTGQDHQCYKLSAVSSPASSDSQLTEDIGSPPSVILHSFFSELSNGHQLYQDPYDSEEECNMLGQSPSSDYANTLDFYMTSDKNCHQADSPVFFQGFPMLNMAKVD